jgi:hypothetical protein
VAKGWPGTVEGVYMVPITFLYPLYILFICSGLLFNYGFLFIVPLTEFIRSDASADLMLLWQYIPKPEKWSLQFLKK